MAKKKKKALLDDSSLNSFSPQNLSENVAVTKSGNAKHKENSDTLEKKTGGSGRKSNIEKISTGKKASRTAGAKKTTTETQAAKKKIAENTDSKPKLETDENTAPKETESNISAIDSAASEKPAGTRRKKKKAKEIIVEMPDEAPRFEIFDVEDSASLEEKAIAALPHAEVEPELLNYDPDEIEDTHESPEDAEKYERFLEDYKAVMAEMLKAAKQSPRESEESSEIDDEDDISDFIVTDETTHEDREDDELIDEDFLISAETAFEEKAEKIEADEVKDGSEEAETIEETELFEEAKDTEEPVIIEEAEVVDEPEIVEEADIADEAKVIEEAEIADEAEVIKATEVADEAKAIEETEIADEAEAIEETEIADEAEAIEETEIADEAETIPSEKRDRSIDNIYAEDIIIENSEEQEELSENEEEIIPAADEDQDGNEDIQLSMDIQEPELAKRDAEDDYEDEPEEKKYDPEHPRRIDSLFETVELCVFALAIVMVLITFFFRYSIVDGSSMNSTLHDGDFLIISEFLYEPERGDIVVFEYEDKETGARKPLVKRVIGIEGDTVEITPDGSVILNGDAIDESEYLYIDYGYYPNARVWTVGEGEIFVLGDHRNNSNDSEDFGPVSSDTVIGKALFRFFPFESFGAIE